MKIIVRYGLTQFICIPWVLGIRYPAWQFASNQKHLGSHYNVMDVIVEEFNDETSSNSIYLQPPMDIDGELFLLIDPRIVQQFRWIHEATLAANCDKPNTFTSLTIKKYVASAVVVGIEQDCRNQRLLITQGPRYCLVYMRSFP
jgi:hypothetical protein